MTQSAPLSRLSRSAMPSDYSSVQKQQQFGSAMPHISLSTVGKDCTAKIGGAVLLLGRTEAQIPSNSVCCAGYKLSEDAVDAKLGERPSLRRSRTETQCIEDALEAEREKESKATAPHHTFAWLEWSPQVDSPCYRALHRHFPGALPGKVVHDRSQLVLTDPMMGLSPDDTLFGASICPDEINYTKGGLAHIMKEFWGVRGEMFPLGGISGAPFSGKTGFRAFSSHVPHNGNVLVLFGPHVAISEAGEVGKYLRAGQHRHSTACGAVIGAFNSCCGNHEATVDDPDETDMQMEFIRNHLAPHYAEIQAAENPMASLAHHAFKMVATEIEKVVNNDFGEGALVLLGGITINMPEPYEEHFFPCTFEVRRRGEHVVDLMHWFHCPLTQEYIAVQELSTSTTSSVSSLSLAAASTLCTTCSPLNRAQIAHVCAHGASSPSAESASDSGCELPGTCDGELTNMCRAHSYPTSIEFALDDDNDALPQHHVFSWLGWAPPVRSPCYLALRRHFPGALPGKAVHARSRMAITGDRYGLTPTNTLFGHSICPDEINYEHGGLSDIMRDYWGEMFPLGGIGGAPFSGKTGFSAFSNHVPDNGNIFVLFGPHVAVSEEGEIGKYLRKGQHQHSAACGAVIGAYQAHTSCDASASDFDDADMQMAWIKRQLAPHVKRIQQEENSMAALAKQAFELVKKQVLKVVNNDFGDGYLVLLGGIQINMPEPYDDQFVPLLFEVRKKGELADNLMSSF